MGLRPTKAEIQQAAMRRDIEPEHNRWRFGERDGITPAELEQLLCLGRCSDAKAWLIHMRPENMFPDGPHGRQVGTYTLGQRLTAAQNMADKAGVPLEVLAAECGCTDMLSVTPEPLPPPRRR